jgi:hypothetical protein
MSDSEKKYVITGMALTEAEAKEKGYEGHTIEEHLAMAAETAAVRAEAGPDPRGIYARWNRPKPKKKD